MALPPTPSAPTELGVDGELRLPAKGVPGAPPYAEEEEEEEEVRATPP